MNHKRTIVALFISAITLCCSTAFAQVNLSKGLMVWLPINGGAKDMSGNGYSVTVNSGTLTTDRFGVANSAYSFSGSVGLIVTNVSNKGYTGATISFWMKTTNTTIDVQIFNGPPGVEYIGLYSTSHLIGSFDGSGNGKSSSDETTSSVTTGNWVHVVCKNDGYTTYEYINGKLETSYASTQTTFQGDLHVPDYNSYYGVGYNGLMDDIRAYHRSLSDSEVMALYELPHAAFGAKSQCVTDSLRFLDSSVAVSGSKYLWRFGDGTTSTKQAAAHLYAKSGTYTVTEIVTSPYNSIDSTTRTITVNPLPKAHFSFTVNSNTHQVQFVPADTSLASYSWDFGDTTSSTAKKPLHVYKYSADFTVTLKVANSNGCDSTYQLILQMAKVAFSVKNNCLLSGTQFSDSSVEPASCTYLWNFGDKTTSTLKNPVHTYAATGTYTVSFRVTSPLGLADSIQKQVTIYPAPSASFSELFNKYKITFVPKDNSGTSYSWDFGDTSQSLAKSPSHTYGNYGTYTVTLTIANTYGCDSTLKVPITLLQLPAVSFSASNICLGDSLYPTNNSTAPAGSSYTWYFGDNTSSNLKNPSHKYALAGTYILSLKIANSQGATDSASKAITVFALPLSAFTFSQTKYTVKFTATDTSTTYAWDFGDQNSSSAQNPTHTYSTAGTYTVTLTESNGGGCKSTTQKTIIIYNAPTASFTAAPVCEGSQTVFDNTSTAANGSTYNWGFGDGSFAKGLNPTHIYASAGTYHVSLKVIDPQNLSDSVNQTVTVYPDPSANFHPSINKFRVTFVPKDSTLSSYAWDFGDSTNSISKKPVHTYSYPATFSVTLSVKNADGCDSTMTQQVTVDGTTGINENSMADKALTLFPNPANGGTVHLAYQASGPQCRIEIVDINGKIVYDASIDKNHITQGVDIPLIGYAKGIYLLKIIDGSGTAERKLVLE